MIQRSIMNNASSFIFSALLSFTIFSAKAQDKNTLLEQAHQSFLNGDYTNSINTSNLILKDYPREHKALYLRGVSYQLTGQPKMALLDYNTLLKDTITYEHVHYYLGILYGEQALYPKALAEIDLELKYNLQFAPAYFSRGFYTFTQQMYNSEAARKAITYYKKAIAIDPSKADYYYHIGMAQEWAQQKQEALRSYTTAVQKAPYELAYYKSRAVVQTDLRLPETQIKAGYQEAVNNFKQYDDSKDKGMSDYYVSESFTYMGQHDDSVLFYINRALEKNPGNYKFHTSKAQFYYYDENYKEALIAIEKAIALHPADDEPWEWYGTCLLALNYKKEARAAYLKALEYNPRNATAYSGAQAQY